MNRVFWVIVLGLVPLLPASAQNWDINTLHTVNSWDGKFTRDFSKVASRSEAYIAVGVPIAMAVAASAFALATSLSIRYPKWYVIAPSALWACSVGFSRMNQGAHYPSDVLAGAAIGIGFSFANIYINRWLNKWLFGE